MTDLENNSKANQEVKALEHRRRIVIEKFERFKLYQENVDKDNIDECLYGILSSRLEKLEPLWYEYNEIQGEIELLIPENGVENSKQRDLFENLYFPLVGSIKSVIKKYDKGSEKGTSVSGSDSGSGQHLTVVQSEVQSSVKLPPIKIPVFDGNYSNWMEFKEIFIALVDTNHFLTDTQKFY